MYYALLWWCVGVMISIMGNMSFAQSVASTTVGVTLANSYSWSAMFDPLDVVVLSGQTYQKSTGVDIIISASTGVVWMITWDIVGWIQTGLTTWPFSLTIPLNFTSTTGIKTLSVQFVRNGWEVLSLWTFTLTTTISLSPIITSASYISSQQWGTNFLGADFVDLCPGGDRSISYYDGICNAPSISIHNADKSSYTYTQEAIQLYGTELIGAYEYAFAKGITTIAPISKADMYQPLLRKHMAKMISVFAMKVMNKKPDMTRECNFPDMSGENNEMQNYSLLACQLGLMGLRYDGVPDVAFNGNLPVSRAMFGTIVSRLIFGIIHNKDATPENRYGPHLSAMKRSDLIKKIDEPTINELRWYSMLIMQRVDQQKERLGIK